VAERFVSKAIDHGVSAPSSTGPAAAIEAYWRAEPEGMCIVLAAIVEQPSWRHPRYTEVELARVPAGRDHTGPSWPEAADAAELGERLSAELGAPFHFASRDRPSDEVVRWWNRGLGRPCDDCGLELDQNPAVHWFGMCYACHLAREHRQPRLHVELLSDVDAGEYERILRIVDASLHAARSGLFHAGSRIAGAQSIWFLTNDAGRAAEVAVTALREAGVLDHVRIRIVRGDPRSP
jgi:hypothetical protein